MITDYSVCDYHSDGNPFGSHLRNPIVFSSQHRLDIIFVFSKTGGGNRVFSDACSTLVL